MQILQGYLAAIPTIEKDRITNIVKSILKENKVYEFTNLENYSLKTSEDNIDFSRKPSDTYNNIFLNTNMDLSVLNLLLNELDNQIISYDILIESLLKEVNKDIELVEAEIDKIENTYYYNESEFNEDFKSNVRFETSTSNNRYLYQDRDGNIKNPVSLNNKRISLRVTEKNDLLRNNRGQTSAKIKITNYQGLPIETINIPENAIDNSSFTYWDASSLQDKRIELGYNQWEKYGHYIDFTILLSKFTHINEISFNHVSNFNIDICQVYIDGQPTLENPVKVTDKFTLTLEDKYGEEVRFVIRQRTYSVGEVTINEKLKDMEDLWNTAYQIKSYNPQNTVRDFDYYHNKYKNEIKTVIHNLIAGETYE